MSKYNPPKDFLNNKHSQKKNEADIYNKEIPIWKKLNLTIKEAVEYSNIGENKIRQLLNTPGCPFVIYIGNKKLIKRKEFEEWLKDQEFL